MNEIGKLQHTFNDEHSNGLQYLKIKSNPNRNQYEKKAKPKVRNIKGIAFGTCLSLAGLGVLFGPNIKEIIKEKIETNVETNFAKELVDDNELLEYNLLDSKELNEFSALLIQTDYLLKQQDLPASDKIKLQENFATIKANLGNVVGYSESQIEKTISTASGTEVDVNTYVDAGSTYLEKGISIRLKEFIEKESFSGNIIHEDKTYNYSGDILDFNSIKAGSLEKLFDEHIELFMLNNGNIDLNDKKTFELVLSVFNDARNLNNIPLTIDEKGNIIEEENDLEK